MPKIFGELKDASLENLSSDPVANTQGRMWYNQTEGRFKLDSGINKRALLRNDDKLTVGNSSTSSENIRLNRGNLGLLQLLKANNLTAEGAMSAADLAELSSRLENYTNAGKPAPGNPGRVIYITDLLELQYDNGATWLPVAGSSTGGFGAAGVLPVSANIILNAGDSKRILLCDSSGGSFTIELPAPSAGFLFSIKDYLGTFATNPVTITRPLPSTRIEGLTSDYILNTTYGSWNLFCDGTHYFFQ